MFFFWFVRGRHNQKCLPGSYTSTLALSASSPYLQLPCITSPLHEPHYTITDSTPNQENESLQLLRILQNEGPNLSFIDSRSKVGSMRQNLGLPLITSWKEKRWENWMLRVAIYGVEGSVSFCRGRGNYYTSHSACEKLEPWENPGSESSMCYRAVNAASVIIMLCLTSKRSTKHKQHTQLL